MLNPFAYIRSRVRAAVIEGFADGLAVIDQGEHAIDNTIPAALVERLKLPTPALPSSEPVDAEPDNSKPRSRKASAA